MLARRDITGEGDGGQGLGRCQQSWPTAWTSGEPVKLEMGAWEHLVQRVGMKGIAWGKEEVQGWILYPLTYKEQQRKGNQQRTISEEGQEDGQRAKERKGVEED